MAAAKEVERIAGKVDVLVANAVRGESSIDTFNDVHHFFPDLLMNAI